MKVVVAHPFQQHSFRTAAALKKTGNLYKYVTTVYLKKGTLTSFLSKLLKGDNLKRTLGRRSEELSDENVIVFSEWANLLLLFFRRIDKKRHIYNWWYQITICLFNRSLFKYVKKSRIDAIILYDTLAKGFIELAKKNQLDIKIIIDMSAPNALYMRDTFENEIQNEEYKEEIKGNLSTKFGEKCIAAQVELQEADAFLVASEFTRESLIWGHVDQQRIYKCTYGVYENGLATIKKTNDKIKCSFIGAVSMQKGAFRLFHIIDSIARSDLEFHFYGAYDKESEYYAKYKDKCFFHGHIPHSDILKELENNDIVIFPSLADGFGFSVTEALMRKNIAICSKNAGVSELIIDGKNGLVYNIGEEDKVVSFLSQVSRRDLSIMQETAPDTLRKYTWDKYNEQVNKAVKNVVGTLN